MITLMIESPDYSPQESAVVAVPVGVCGVLFGRPLLELMGATPGVLANASYTRIVLGANGVILTLFLINAVFRGAQKRGVEGEARVRWLA